MMTKSQKITKEELISVLRQKSMNSKSSDSFKKSLYESLDRSLNEQEENLFNFSFIYMAKRYIMLGVFVVAVAFLGGAVLLNNNLNSLKERSLDSGAFLPDQESPELDVSDAAGGGSTRLAIPMDYWDTFSEAQDVMKFDVREPQVSVDGAILAEIRTSKDFEAAEGAKSTGLYLTYKKGDKVSYVVNQTEGPATLMEGQSILVDGVTGYYFMVDGEYDPESIVVTDDTGYPRSSIQWNKGSINYYVAEYGTMSKSQLLQLANSLR